MIICTRYEILEWDDRFNPDLENDSLIADAAMDRISNDAFIIVEELLSHLDELNVHIKNLDDEIDDFMKPEEKNASQVIQDLTGIGNTSARAVISVIGTDMSRFKADAHISPWAGLCPGDNQSAGKRKSGKTRKKNCLTKSHVIIIPLRRKSAKKCRQ